MMVEDQSRNHRHVRSYPPPPALGYLTLGLVLLQPSGCLEQRCFEHADCDAPQICSPTGQCGYECSVREDCATGFFCTAHRCQPEPQGPITCPADMVAVADTFCVDRYEASRPDATADQAGVDGSRARSVAGVVPWRVADNPTAEAACQAASKRLCAPAEWQLACSGPDGTVYSYGDPYEPQTCNGIDTFGRTAFHLMPTGSFPDCTNAWGAFDLNGNLWEHVAGGSEETIRGGAYNCGDSAKLHRCDYIPGDWQPSARGFRCCLTPPSATGAPDGGVPDQGT